MIDVFQISITGGFQLLMVGEIQLPIFDSVQRPKIDGVQSLIIDGVRNAKMFDGGQFPSIAKVVFIALSHTGN